MIKPSRKITKIMKITSIAILLNASIRRKMPVIAPAKRKDKAEIIKTPAGSFLLSL